MDFRAHEFGLAYRIDTSLDEIACNVFFCFYCIIPNPFLQNMFQLVQMAHIIYLMRE